MKILADYTEISRKNLSEQRQGQEQKNLTNPMTAAWILI